MFFISPPVCQPVNPPINRIEYVIRRDVDTLQLYPAGTPACPIPNTGTEPANQPSGQPADDTRIFKHWFLDDDAETDPMPVLWSIHGDLRG